MSDKTKTPVLRFPDSAPWNAEHSPEKRGGINNETVNEAVNEAIRNTPGINKPRLIKVVGKSRATVERSIATLIAAGKIEHRGSKKTGGYYAI